MKVIHMFVVVINSSASSQLATSVTCVQYDFDKPHTPCLCSNGNQLTNLIITCLLISALLRILPCQASCIVHQLISHCRNFLRKL